MSRGEVFIEFTAAGGSVKVTAIDGETGVEVSIIGPVTAWKGDLQRLAVAKLARRLGREASDLTPNEKTAPGPGRGLIV